MRLRPERSNHVWAEQPKVLPAQRVEWLRRDATSLGDRTREGCKFRMLNVVEPSGSPDVDEFTRECLAIRVGCKLKAADVIDVLADLFNTRGMPGHIRSDNGLGFAAVAVRGWITGVRSSTACIGPGSPRENGTVESFNGKLRDELLGCEVCNTLAEARVLIEPWRRPYNTVRPHSSLSDQPPAPEAVLTKLSMLPGLSGPTGSAPPRPAMHQHLTQIAQ